MQQAPSSLQDRLAPAEEIFFGWLLRVFAAATLVGSAWIDDAPPLEIGAMIIATYVAVRVLTQFGRLAAAAPSSGAPCACSSPPSPSLCSRPRSPSSPSSSNACPSRSPAEGRPGGVRAGRPASAVASVQSMS